MLKKGFTLAEVLLTLTIIGVVAAITMPALMTNVNDHVLETQTRKFYSQLIGALDLYKETNRIDALASGLNIPQFSGFFNTSSMIGQADVDNNLAAQYTNMNRANAITRNNFFGAIDNNNPLYRLRDGSVFTVRTGNDDNPWVVAVDVNGLRTPNQYGADAWIMVIDVDGRIRITGDNNVQVSAANCLAGDINGSCIAEFAASNFRFRQYRDLIANAEAGEGAGAGNGGASGGTANPTMQPITTGRIKDKIFEFREETGLSKKIQLDAKLQTKKAVEVEKAEEAFAVSINEKDNTRR